MRKCFFGTVMHLLYWKYLPSSLEHILSVFVFKHYIYTLSVWNLYIGCARAWFNLYIKSKIRNISLIKCQSKQWYILVPFDFLPLNIWAAKTGAFFHSCLGYKKMYLNIEFNRWAGMNIFHINLTVGTRYLVYLNHFFLFYYIWDWTI